MATKKTKEVEPTPTESTLSSKEISRAVTNSPLLAVDEFQIKDRVFKIVDLGYDDYLDFIALFKPMFEQMAGVKKEEPTLPGISLTDPSSLKVDSLIMYCKKDLPALACIVCNAQERAMAELEKREPNPANMVEPQWLKDNSNPIRLANIVLKQLLQNNMISEFADFFVQALPILRAIRM